MAENEIYKLPDEITRGDVAKSLASWGEDATRCDVERAFFLVAARLLDPPPDPNAVEVRVHVRVDVLDDGETSYNAAGWGTDGKHEVEVEESLEGETDTARYSVITARVPKPAPVTEVEGTVES